MYAEYRELKDKEGFSALSQDARDFIAEYCDLGEIRFCDTCGTFLEGDFIWGMGLSPSQDFCSNECMAASGYSRKDFIQDYYLTPYEGEEGYAELMKAKADMDDEGFGNWVQSRYGEDTDAPVFWTEDQFPAERNEGAAAEAIEWLRSQTMKAENTEYKENI